MFLGVHITEDLTWTTNTMSLSKKAHSAYTFSAGWKEQVSLHPSSPHSTGAPLRVCWPAVSLSGTGTAVLLTARPSSGQWTRLQRSSVPLSHPSWTFPSTMLQQNQQHREGPPPTPPTVSSSSYHQEDGTGASESAPPDCSTAFSTRLWEPWTLITPPPSETPCKTPTSWNIAPPPLSKHPPNLPRQRKNWNFFVQFKVCYTQVSGPVQTTCSNTLSSMRTRHFSKHCYVYTIPQKTQQYMYVYMLMHYKSSCTVPQPAADSQCFSLHMYSIYVKHS